MEQENRLKITVWLKPDVVQRMDGWLKRTTAKAAVPTLRFYMGYLATEDTSVFLSAPWRHPPGDRGDVFMSAHLIFKWCVELNMMGHTIAAHFRADDDAVDEVRRTNGQISFDRALDQQRRFPDEDVFDDDV